MAAFQIPVETILLGEIRQWQDSGQGTCVDFKRFCKEPFVLLRNEQHIGHMMSQLFQRYAFEPMHSITVEQTMTSYGLTLAGAGISLMTESTIRHSHFKDYPTFYLADPELCQRDMYVAYPKQRYLSRAAKEFIAILKTSLQKF